MDDLPDGNPLWLLTSHLALLSFAAVGGGVIMLAPDIHRYVVDVHHWIDAEQFSAAYASRWWAGRSPAGSGHSAPPPR